MTNNASAQQDRSGVGSEATCANTTNASGGRARYSNYIHWALWLILAVASLRSVYVLINGAQLLHLPFESTKPEAFILHGIQRIAQHEPLYQPLGEMPFIVHVYNPLTYVLPGLAGRMFDLDSPHMLLVGRYISYLSTLILGVLLAVWVKRTTGDWKSALLAGLGIFYFHAVALTDFFRCRPESPGLLFTFSGVIMLLSAWRWRAPASAVLFFLAFLYKQSFIAAPISAAAFFLLAKQYRHALTFSLTIAGLLMAFCIIMYRTTQERYFQNAVVALAVNDVRPIESAATVYGKPLVQALYGLLPAVPLAVSVLIAGKNQFYLIIYFFVCLGWSFYSAGKIGAQANYYAEFAVLSLVIVALAAGSREWQRRPIVLAMLGLLASQALIGIAHHGILGERIPVAGKDVTPYVERYKQVFGSKLITHEEIAIHLGEIVGLDWVLLEHLAEKRRIDLSSIFRQISKGAYAMVILNQHVATRLEMRILYAVKEGPYKLAYFDDTVSEWVPAR